MKNFPCSLNLSNDQRIKEEMDSEGNSTNFDKSKGGGGSKW